MCHKDLEYAVCLHKGIFIIGYFQCTSVYYIVVLADLLNGIWLINILHMYLYTLHIHNYVYIHLHVHMCTYT